MRTGAALLGLAATLSVLLPSIGSTPAGAAPGVANLATITWKMSQHAFTSSSLSPSHATEAPATKDPTNGFVFPGGGGTFDPATGAANLHFGGSFTLGNVVQGGYRIKIANPNLVLDGGGTGRLIADVSHCASAAICASPGVTTTQDVVVANLTGIVLSTDGNERTATVIPEFGLQPGQPEGGLRQFPQTLLDALDPGLQGHFKQTGSGSDSNKPPAPLSITFTAVPPTTTSTSTTSTSTSTSTSMTTSMSTTSTSTSTTVPPAPSTSTLSTSTTSTTAPPATTSTTSSTTSTTAPPATTSTSTSTSTSSTTAPPASSTPSSTSSTSSSTSTTAPTEGDPIETGTLDWGVKASFRSYITGPIAHGSATPSSGATANADGTYRFPLDDGTLDGPEEIDADFGGQVRFSGHDGALDLTLSDPRVVIDGDEGVLVVDAASKSLSTGQTTTFDDVTFADLDLFGVTPTADGEQVVLAGIPAVLATAGAPAFADFYEAGAPLDALTLRLTVAAGGDLSPPGSSTSMSPTSTAPAVGCLDKSSVAAGGSLQLCGSGFLPGEQVQVFLHSTPQLVTVLTAASTGSVQASVTIPASAPAGSHRVELRGVSTGRSLMSAPFTVTAAASEGSLPRTGAMAYDGLRVALVLLGVGLLLQGRSMARRAAI